MSVAPQRILMHKSLSHFFCHASSFPLREMDIWEANSISQAMTTHTCSTKGLYKCEGADCGDIETDERYDGVCDKDGCDLAPYRSGNTNFFGAGSDFSVDSSKKMTVVTQFITEDGTDDGDLKEIRRLFVQDGKVIDTPDATYNGESYNSITDDFCTAQKKVFNETNDNLAKGGIKGMGEAMDRGMVLIMVNNLTLIIFFSPHDGISCHVPLKQMLSVSNFKFTTILKIT